MAIEAINSIKTVIAKSLSTKTTDAVAKKAVKNGEELMAAGQDASANYNRAMVTAPKFKKPNMEKANIGAQETKAASGEGFDGGWTPGEGGFPSGARGYDSSYEADFENEVSGLLNDMGF